MTKVVKSELEKLGEKVLTEIDKKENPSIDIPIRALSNVIFDKKSGQLTLGDKTAKRYFFNVAHAKKFMQTLMVRCQDDKIRLCRIPGKLRKRVWMHEGDIVLVEPWEIQGDTNADIVMKYNPTQAHWLRKKGILKMDL